MNKKLLRFAISFLSGLLWAFFALSTILTFTIFIRSSLAEAVLFSALMAIFWLFWIVIIEIANLQLEKLDELKKQTKLLQEIANK
jgi:glucan phosphoethanolaminetransferase (alkaline phosphatase superfamily)